MILLLSGLAISIVQGGATAAVAAGVGAFAWKSRDILASAAWGTAKGIGESTSRSMGRAFQAKGFTGILSHPLTMAGFGAVAGGLIGSKLSDDPIKGAAAGAAIGGITTLAARGATKAWGGSPWYAKAAMVAAAALEQALRRAPLHTKILMPPRITPSVTARRTTRPNQVFAGE